MTRELQPAFFLHHPQLSMKQIPLQMAGAKDTGLSVSQFEGYSILLQEEGCQSFILDSADCCQGDIPGKCGQDWTLYHPGLTLEEALPEYGALKILEPHLSLPWPVMQIV